MRYTTGPNGPSPVLAPLMLRGPGGRPRVPPHHLSSTLYRTELGQSTAAGLVATLRGALAPHSEDPRSVSLPLSAVVQNPRLQRFPPAPVCPIATLSQERGQQLGTTHLPRNPVPPSHSEPLHPWPAWPSGSLFGECPPTSPGQGIPLDDRNPIRRPTRSSNLGHHRSPAPGPTA